MAYSTFPHGFSAGVTIRGVPVEISHPGKVFWVGNNTTRIENEATAADGNDGTFLRPFATLMGAYASSSVVAGRGDVIFVRPGYTETLSSATLWALNKAGVAIVGLGAGTSRPTVTLTAATATITVSAANNAIRNFIFVANADDVAALFNVTTAVNLSIEDCNMRDTAASANFLVIVDTNATDNAADGLFMARNVVNLLKATGNRLIKVDGSIDNLVVEDNYVRTASTSTTVGMIEVPLGADVLTNMRVNRNFYRASAAMATGIFVTSAGAMSTATGIVANNTAQVNAVSTALAIVANAGVVSRENYTGKSTASVSARLIPVALAVD